MFSMVLPSYTSSDTASTNTFRHRHRRTPTQTQQAKTARAVLAAQARASDYGHTATSRQKYTFGLTPLEARAGYSNGYRGMVATATGYVLDRAAAIAARKSRVKSYTDPERCGMPLRPDDVEEWQFQQERMALGEGAAADSVLVPHVPKLPQLKFFSSTKVRDRTRQDVSAHDVEFTWEPHNPDNPPASSVG
mmetsp:Transcript_4632/g.8898  ORF Transcript_4632/g.8898 Transcript_4632/m.8898 type:complete len:192 (+) Transcript_4632:908-1483(+)